MQSLEKRIAALETANLEAGFPDTIFILFLQPGETECEIHKLHSTPAGPDRLGWIRGSNESEQEFKDRASKEAPRNAGGIAMLFMSE